MLLTDNVSLLLSIPQPFRDINIDPDPDYFFDLKLHFRQKENHWKTVKEYRKAHFENKDNRYRLDGEINYILDEVKTFHQDVDYFIRANPHMDAGEGAHAFCNKWRGYLSTYGEEIVLRAFLRNSYYRNVCMVLR